jgi:hypothetical protein
MVDVHDHLVQALVTLHSERPHAVLAHVGEVHRLIGEAGGGHLAWNPLDLIPADFEGLHDCLRLSHCKEGIEDRGAASTLNRQKALLAFGADNFVRVWFAARHPASDGNPRMRSGPV